MAMKLTVGLARKVGLAGFGSLGASCTIELDIDGSLGGPGDATFHDRVRAAYAACRRAIEDELTRQIAAPVGPKTPAEAETNRGEGEAEPPATTLPAPRLRPPPPRLATGPQVHTLRMLARRRGLDLEAMVAGRFGVAGPESLTVADASRLIGELRSSPELARQA